MSLQIAYAHPSIILPVQQSMRASKVRLQRILHTLRRLPSWLVESLFNDCLKAQGSSRSCCSVSPTQQSFSRPRASAGAPPASRIVVTMFENSEKAKAAYNSPVYLEARKVGDKYGNLRIFAVEGIVQQSRYR